MNRRNGPGSPLMAIIGAIGMMRFIDPANRNRPATQTAKQAPLNRRSIDPSRSVPPA
ncbi:MAG: hypothetical protein ACRD1V_05320 [Vicinamibacterales bacterium]